ISPENRAHPEVLSTRWQIYCMAEKWESANEIAWVFSEAMATHMARSLHEMKRTDGARRLLLTVVDKFPDNHLMRYNLACYASQLGDFKEARKWLEQAFGLSKDLRETALDEPDLQPLWDNIGNI